MIPYILIPKPRTFKTFCYKIVIRAIFETLILQKINYQRKNTNDIYIENFKNDFGIHI